MAPVAYARVMFLGPGGSGKSSLLDGLMDQPLRPAESTAVADVLDIKYHWVEAADAAEDAWRLMTEEDEVQELTSLYQSATKDEPESGKGASAEETIPITTATTLFSALDEQNAAQIQKHVRTRVVEKACQLKEELQQQQQVELQKQQEQLQQQQQMELQQLRQQPQMQRKQWRVKQVQQQQQQQEERLKKQQQLQKKRLNERQREKHLKKQQQLQEKHLKKQQQQLQERHSKKNQQLQKRALQSKPSKDPEVVMRIWDCGGQPIFLDILSAFLTSHTMFLLLFDASLPLADKWQESWRYKGCTYQGKKLNITFLQLMMQWMRLIHASLVAKNEVGTVAKKATYSENTTDRKEPISLPPCPRIMIVGTHGDKVSPMQTQQVLKDIDSSCRGKAFRDLVIDKLVINNTTAGRGKGGDPGYRRIRKSIHEFAHSLATPTPVAWVSFRKVLQKAAIDSPVLSYERVITIAKACEIPRSKVPNVLHFYHQLGVFLHYAKIESLSTTIIAEPQWLMKQLSKLLMPEWYYPRPQRLATLWEWLEEKGVMLEPLYQDMWWDCGLEKGAQALVDLLVHFDLVAEISRTPREMERYEGCKYFVPCMLKNHSQEDPDQNTETLTGQPVEFVQKAATLHILFNTGYIPPGFFVRLAARITKSERCTPIFERGIYRNSITFRYGEADRVTITESKSLISVHVDFIRVVKRPHSIARFAESCLSFRRELYSMCREVLLWLPSIELDFAFKCKCSGDAGKPFAIFLDGLNRDTKMFCLHDREHQLDAEHKYWLPPAQYTLQVCINCALGTVLVQYIIPYSYTLQPGVEDGEPTKSEMENVVKEVKIRGGRGDLAREMEMEYDPKEKSPEYVMISNWVMYEKGTRYKLAEHLREAGLTPVSTM